MEINKGDKLWLKSRYDWYYEVVVRAVQGEYAIVKGSQYFGTKKVRVDKLYKQPSQSFTEFLQDFDKKQKVMERELNMLKGRG